MKQFRSTVFLLVLLGTSGVSHAVDYEYREVTVAGTSQCESTRDSARKWAELSTRNNAHDACSSLGKGWSYDSVVVQGYVGYKACISLGDGFLATFENSTHRCRRLDKEATKQKAEAEKAQREPGMRANTLDRPVGLGEQIEREKANSGKPAREVKKTAEEERLKIDKRQAQDMDRKALVNKLEKERLERERVGKDTANGKPRPSSEKNPVSNSIDGAFSSLDRKNSSSGLHGFDGLDASHSDSGRSGLDALDKTSRKTGLSVDAQFAEVELRREENLIARLQRERAETIAKAHIDDEKNAEAARESCTPKELHLFMGWWILAQKSDDEVLQAWGRDCDTCIITEEIRTRFQRDHEKKEQRRASECRRLKAIGPMIESPEYKARLKAIDEKIVSARNRREAKLQELRKKAN